MVFKCQKKGPPEKIDRSIFLSPYPSIFVSRCEKCQHFKFLLEGGIVYELNENFLKRNQEEISDPDPAFKERMLLENDRRLFSDKGSGTDQTSESEDELSDGEQPRNFEAPRVSEQGLYLCFVFLCCCFFSLHFILS